MRFLEPTITCLVMSHMKPTLREALESLLAQTRLADVQIVVIDSGQWLIPEMRGTLEVAAREGEMAAIYRDFGSLPSIEWYFTGERPGARTMVCPVAHWTNLAIREGLIRGKYLCSFYDDDLLYPTFMEKMAGYLDEHPAALAVRCTENRTQLFPDGRRESTPPLVADREIPGGENLDCLVDGMQVMLRTEVLKRIPDPWLPEDPDIASCSHSDGIFFNKLSAVIDKLHCIPEALCEHRATHYSTYTPTL